VRGTGKSRRCGNCKVFGHKKPSCKNDFRTLSDAERDERQERQQKKTNIKGNKTKNDGPPVSNEVPKNTKKRLHLIMATQNRSEVCTTTTDDDDEVEDVMCTHCRQYGHDITICGNEYKEDDSNNDDYSTELKKKKQQHNTPASNNVHETATSETNEFEIIEDLQNVKAKGSDSIRGAGKSRRCSNCKVFGHKKTSCKNDFRTLSDAERDERQERRQVQKKINAKSNNTKNNGPPVANEVPQNMKKRLQRTRATQNRRQGCTTTTDDDVMCTHCRKYGHDITTCGNEYKDIDSYDSDYSTQVKKKKQQQNTTGSDNVHETNATKEAGTIQTRRYTRNQHRAATTKNI
ncbi:hypothetical protein LINGRAHAP2_LOCUS27688, partial [Linum grandiflorum]